MCEKIGVLRKNTNRNSKLGWEIRLETQIRNLKQQTKMLRLRRNAGIYWDDKSKTTQLEQMILLEEINQKVRTKERKLKRYRSKHPPVVQNETKIRSYGLD